MRARKYYGNHREHSEDQCEIEILAVVLEDGGIHQADGKEKEHHQQQGDHYIARPEEEASGGCAHVRIVLFLVGCDHLCYFGGNDLSLRDNQLACTDIS